MKTYRRHGCPWDSEEDAELMRLHRLDFSTEAIGLELGRGENSIKSRRRHLIGMPATGASPCRMVLSSWQWIGEGIKARTLTGL